MSKAKLIGKVSAPVKRKADLRWQRKDAQKRMNEFTVDFTPGSILPRFCSAANKNDVAIANRKKGY